MEETLQDTDTYLSYARLRAIENRRYIIRSANSGVSTIINELGEYDNILPYDEKGMFKWNSLHN